MKRLPLKTVMNSLRIVTLECGYELHNAAGTAKYDAWGARGEVHSIPEYFPVTISLKGPDFAAPDTNEASPEKITEPSLGDLLAMQKAIADQLDHFKGCWEQRLGTSSEGKTPVIMLSDRYTAIGGGYTPEEISAAVEHIQSVRAAEAFSKAAKEVSPFAIKDGEVIIQDAFIGNGITSANWSMKINTDENGHRYAAGVGIAVNNKATKIRLTDDMREAVIDAVRESDVFKALQASQDAQASALVAMQQAIEQTATDAIRNALKPGGLLYRGI